MKCYKSKILLSMNQKFRFVYIKLIAVNNGRKAALIIIPEDDSVMNHFFC